VALSFIGSGSDSASFDPNLTLPGGIAQNDIVYVAVNASGSVDLDLSMITAGYTEIADLYQNDNTDVNLGVFRKIMGVTPDSSAQCETGSTSANAVFHCWRGCDTTTPEDATPTTAGAVDGGTPDPPSINTATANAIVLAIGGSSEGDAVTNPPTNYENLIDLQDGGLRNVMMASRSIASPTTENPGTFADVVGTSSDSWAAVTVAIRPAAAAPPPAVPGPQGTRNQFVALYGGTIDPTMHKIEDGISCFDEWRLAA
jgi:hypothetical protein